MNILRLVVLVIGNNPDQEINGEQKHKKRLIKLIQILKILKSVYKFLVVEFRSVELL